MRAKSALEHRNYEAASDWLQWARYCGSSDRNQLIEEARLARKTFQPVLARDQLRKARLAGLDANRIHKETLLLEADLGQVAVEPDLRNWLIQSADDNAEVCESLANLLLMNGRTEEALHVVAVWKSSFPHDPQPDLVSGRWREARNENVQALADYHDSLTIRPQYAPSQYAMGRLYANRGQWDRARDSFLNAARVLRNDFAAKLCLADCLYQLGELQAARSMLETLREVPEADIRAGFALVQDPHSLRTADGLLGELMTGLGQYTLALPLLEQALSREPRSRPLRYARAQCLLHLGRAEEGRQILRDVALD
jgi:predicted Zn-dependent protease